MTSTGIRARDWRDETEATLSALYAVESARWRDTLAWNTDDNWRIVEAGRRASTVTGFVARTSEGQPAGWCFALIDGETAQVGGFVARTEEATAALVDALKRAGRAGRVVRWVWFGWFDAPGLVDRLAAIGASIGRYSYLVTELSSRDSQSGPAPGAETLRAWGHGDLRLVPLLLASAYGTSEAGRLFASRGRTEEWQAYVAQLVLASGCGIFDPALSVVATGSTGLDGTAMVSRLAPATAHLAQLAVRDSARSRGLGRTLLDAAIARAAAAGCRTMTLLVRDDNDRAGRLYAAAGFKPRATFLAATIDQPWTSSSEALPTAGVSTRR
jgi:ribosomal protein S18 acetylase RimI-like enzyme